MNITTSPDSCKKKPETTLHNKTKIKHKIKNEINKQNMLPLSFDTVRSSQIEQIEIVYKITKDQHDDHAHYSLTKDIDSANKKPESELKQSQEGCPCCTQALDLDEIAAALKEMFFDHDGSKSLYGWAEFSSTGHWIIALGLAAPLSILGLTAATRNIQGCWSNRETLNDVVEKIDRSLEYKQTLLSNLRYQKGDALEKKLNQGLRKEINGLLAFKRTLKYSQFDTDFNLIVPGVINGIASSLVLSTAVWHHPFALIAIALYSSCQLGRNASDLCRTWNHHIEPSTDTSTITNEFQSSGLEKINQIGNVKRQFYASNSTGFALFAIGAMLTFLSVPALGLFAESTDLITIGLVLMGIGAASTAYLNNVGPALFRPRNGELGADRGKLDKESCLEEIGYQRKMREPLKNSRNELYKPSQAKQLGYSLLSALPYGAECGQQYSHDYNKELFKDKSANYAKKRSDVLSKLSNIQSSYRNKSLKNETIEVGPTLKDQWNACINLGFDDEILNTLVTDFSTHSTACTTHKHDHGHSHGHENYLEQSHEINHSQNHVYIISEQHNHETKDNNARNKQHSISPKNHTGCCGHSHGDYEEQLKNAGFKVNQGEEVEFNIDTLNDEQNKMLGNAIDFALHHKISDRYHYQTYGLADFYWALNNTV